MKIIYSTINGGINYLKCIKIISILSYLKLILNRESDINCLNLLKDYQILHLKINYKKFFINCINFFKKWLQNSF